MFLHKFKSFCLPQFPWLMFHVTPALKMLLHATYFHRVVIERVRHFLTIRKKKKCSYKPSLKENIHDLMQAFPLDTESH